MFEKFRESLSIFLLVCLIVLTPVIGPILMVIGFNSGPIYRYLVIAYLIYSFYDATFNYGCYKGCDWFRSSFLFRLTSSYFPQRMIVTEKIPENQNYIIGIHPHGVLTMITSLIADDRVQKQIFGNGRLRYCVAQFNMVLPLQRDWMLAAGLISASERSLMRYLTAKKSGNHAALAIGGANEAILSSATEHRLFLKARKGFCRVALKTGAHLLPAYSFGENLTWHTHKIEKNSFFHKYQTFFVKYFKVGYVLVKGTKENNYSTFMPHRVPITCVLGKPIPVEKVENPTREEVDILHAKYVKGLIQLFDSNKEKYLQDKNAQLIID